MAVAPYMQVVVDYAVAAPVVGDGDEHVCGVGRHGNTVKLPCGGLVLHDGVEHCTGGVGHHRQCEGEGAVATVDSGACTCVYA